MLSGNGIKLFVGAHVRISANSVRKFRLKSNVGVVTEHPTTWNNKEQLVAVRLNGDDFPTDFHAKSLIVIR